MCLWGSWRDAQLVSASCKCEGVALRQARVKKLVAAVWAPRGLLASQHGLIGQLQVQERPDSQNGVERDWRKHQH